MRSKAAHLFLFTALGLLTGCSSDGGVETYDLVATTSETNPGLLRSETGVVVALDSSLAEVHSFSILLSDGSTLELIPQPGLLFEGGPLSHIRDHLVSGAPIRVEFHEDGDPLIATKVADSE